MKASAQAGTIAGEQRRKEIILAVVAAAVVAALYALTIAGFTAESERGATLLVMGDNSPDRLDVLARIISADPVSGDVLVRLEFRPLGTVAVNGEPVPAEDLTVIANTATGRQEQTYEEGEPMSRLDLTINMEGQAAGYPFDKHQVELLLEAARPPAAGAPVSEDEYVPIRLTVAGTLHGLEIEARQSPVSTKTYAVVNLTVSRSLFTIIFAIFAMIVMWAITAVIAFLVLAVVFRQRQPDLTMMTLSAALLFGFYAFRNSMPGTPPIGTLSDVMAFFWAEATAALALVIITIVWVQRSMKT